MGVGGHGDGDGGVGGGCCGCHLVPQESTFVVAGWPHRRPNKVAKEQLQRGGLFCLHDHDHEPAGFGTLSTEQY